MSDKNSRPTGADRYLSVTHLDSDLRGRSARGGAFTIGNQGAKFLLTLGSMAILARLLTPADFGLVAMAAVIVVFISSFKDMGLSMATVQRAELSHEQVSTLFWVNVGLSGLVMLATAALGPILAWFYKEPRLVNITWLLALTVLFSGLTVQHQALLRRQMRFAVLAVIEVISMTVGLACAVGAALAGAGYWALVFMPIIREAAITVGVWIACPWRPGPPVRHSGVRSLLAFGANLTGFNLVNYFARNLDKALIGWKMGAATLGYYNKAYQLLLLPMQQINAPLTTVAVPALSRLQHQLDRYRAYFVRGVMLTASAGMPLVAFLFVDAERAILTILGDQWGQSVPLFRALGPAAFIGTFNASTGWVYISLGLTGRMFKWGVFGAVIAVGAYFIGLHWGALGVAVSLSITLVVLRLPSMVYCFRGTHLTLADAGWALWRPAVSSLLAGVAFYYYLGAVELAVPALVTLFIDFVVYAAFYAVLWIALPGGVAAARSVVHLLADLRRTRERSGPEATTAADDRVKTDV